jgi:DNA end-binding protein Ku
MSKAIVSTNIRFGMINIPVKLHKANKDGDVHFKNIHAICHSPLRQKKWCEKCNHEVLSTELNKGFVLSKDRIVEFSEIELEAIAVSESKHLIVEKVVNLSEIPVTAFDSFYFLQPDKYGEHAYSLMAKALMLKNQVLIGRIVMRSKEHLVAIQHFNGGLMLTTLHWQDELYNINPLLEKLEAVPDEELILAGMLLDRMHGQFVHDQFKDTYRNKVLEIVEKKATGQLITITEIKAEAPRQTDMMEELRRSLESNAFAPAPQIAVKA